MMLSSWFWSVALSIVDECTCPPGYECYATWHARGEDDEWRAGIALDKSTENLAQRLRWDNKNSGCIGRSRV